MFVQQILDGNFRDQSTRLNQNQYI